MHYLHFQVLLALTLLLSFHEATESEEENDAALDYSHIMNFHLGLEDTTAPQELITLIKGIVDRSKKGKRPASEYEIDLQELRSALEEQRNQFINFIMNTFRDQKELLDVPLEIFEHYANMFFGYLTLEEGKHLLEIYQANPELYRKIALRNKKKYWKGFSMIAGDTKILEDGIHKFLTFAKAVDLVKQFITPWVEVQGTNGLPKEKSNNKDKAEL